VCEHVVNGALVLVKHSMCCLVLALQLAATSVQSSLHHIVHLPVLQHDKHWGNEAWLGLVWSTAVRPCAIIAGTC
jgi:hypothetical protein